MLQEATLADAETDENCEKNDNRNKGKPQTKTAQYFKNQPERGSRQTMTVIQGKL
jgi:hypothetical protein